MLYVQMFLFSSALILNKNRLLFLLFESYYLQYIENSVCLLFHYSSNLFLLLYVHVIHWYFFPLWGGDVGILLYTGNRQMIRRLVQYIIHTLVKYLLVLLIIIPRLDHLIGQSIHCLIKVGSPTCTSNWYWQKWIKMWWWYGRRYISEVTLEHFHVGLCSRAPPMCGYENSHTSPLCNTIPSLYGIIVSPAFLNGHYCLIDVL